MFYLICNAVSNGFDTHLEAAKEVIEETRCGCLDHLLEQLVWGIEFGCENEGGAVGGWGIEVKVALDEEGGAAHVGFTLPLQQGRRGNVLPGEEEGDDDAAAAAAPGKQELEAGVGSQFSPAGEAWGALADDDGGGEGVPNGRLLCCKLNCALKPHLICLLADCWLATERKRPSIL